MSYHSILLAECPAMQESIDEAWMNDPTIPNDPMPLYNYLFTPDNRNGINSKVVREVGKVRKLEVVWDQRVPDTEEVVIANGRTCEIGEKRGNFSEEIDIDTDSVIVERELIEESDLARICEANEPFVAKRLAQLFDLVDRRTARRIYSEIPALIGQYSADAVDYFNMSDPSIIEVATQNTTGDYKIGAWQNVSMASRMSGWNSVIGFGGAAMQQYLEFTLAGCCSNSGIDVLELYNQHGMAYGYDYRLAQALGDNNSALAMEMGALQVIDYVQYPGLSNIYPGGKYFKFNAVTPRGLRVDVLIEETCDGLNMSVYSNTKTIAKPLNMYASGDNFFGVNGTGLVEVDNP